MTIIVENDTVDVRLPVDYAGQEDERMRERVEKLFGGNGWFWLGLAVVLLSLVPYLILGTGAYVEYFEQLDWGVITYIYQAKYLFSGSSVIPEFLNGASKNALVAPTPGYVLVYRILPPFAAWLFMQISVQIVAYVGMYLLLDMYVRNKLIKAAVSLMFAFLPILAVFGLTILGVPLVIWAILRLYEGKGEKAAFGCVVFFSFFSSLIYSGFAVLILWTLLIFFTLVKGQKKGGLFYLSYFAMILIYLLMNLDLVLQFMGIGETYVSHRADRGIETCGFREYFVEAFLYNDQHTIDFHRFFLPVIVVSLAVFAVRLVLIKRKGSRGEERQGYVLLSGFALLLFLYLFATVWNIAPVVSLREKLGGLGSFNAARVIWLAPAFWYFLLGVSLDYLLNCLQRAGNRTIRGVTKYAVYAGLCAGFLLILKENQIKENVQLLINPDYDVITYEDYYAIDLMDQLEAYIRDEFGMEMEEYRVISLGIDPAAALYHGFYCMDGYSDNYDVEYKYLFRTFMAPELERNDYIRSYYDDWGNRVYLFTSELTTYFNVEKGSFWFNDLKIDTAAIKEAGCDFIISAAYVVNAEEENMELLATFETEESYYRLYLYQIMD